MMMREWGWVCLLQLNADAAPPSFFVKEQLTRSREEGTKQMERGIERELKEEEVAEGGKACLA
jgi:hypothetical protein